jgi:hypothetical protein
MVDNIQFNKISPLLSSAERVKRVDRRLRDGQQAPFNDDPQGKQKKKKKKHPGHGAALTETSPSVDISPHPGRAVTHRPEEETSPSAGRGKRIIDIHV